MPVGKSTTASGKKVRRPSLSVFSDILWSVRLKIVTLSKPVSFITVMKCESEEMMLPSCA